MHHPALSNSTFCIIEFECDFSDDLHKMIDILIYLSICSYLLVASNGRINARFAAHIGWDAKLSAIVER